MAQIKKLKPKNPDSKASEDVLKKGEVGKEVNFEERSRIKKWNRENEILATISDQLLPDSLKRQLRKNKKRD